jgi:NAD(P)H-dependent FMN reductase
MDSTEVGSPLLVAVIIGSTRQGRVGDHIAHWFAAQARQRADLELTVVDLADFDLPARYPDGPTPQVATFTAAVARAEAFVVVTPEYNRSFPASLKQAIDLVYDEWRAKPVGFVSYGCGSDGMYAVEQLRTVFTELHATTVRNTVGFNLMDSGPGLGGRPGDPDRAAQSAATMLDQLIWWGRALRDARAAHPYVS